MQRNHTTAQVVVRTIFQARYFHHSLKRLLVAAAGFMAAAVIGLNMMSSGPEPTPLNLDQFADQHNVRLSVEDGVTGVPVIAPGATP